MNKNAPKCPPEFENRTLTRRQFLRYAGLLGVSLSSTQALLACAPPPLAQPTEAPAAQETEAPAPTPEAMQEAVTLHWYNPHGAPTFMPHWEQIISGFEAEHPNITISNDIVGWGDIFAKLSADVAAGTLPDMTTLGMQGVLGFHTQGVAVGTDPVIEMLRSDGIEYNRALLKQAEFDGKHYGLPRYMVFTGITYRKDWFEEAGIEAAGTMDKLQYSWDEFADLCKQLHNPPDRYAFAAPWGTKDGVKQVWNFFLGNGITLLAEDGSLDWQADKIKETYQFLIDITQSYAPPGSVTYALENVNTAFREGNVAMAWGDGDVHLELNENKPDWMESDPGAHLGFMPHPYKSEPKNGMFGGGVGFILFDAGHIEETYQWCRHFMQDDNLIESIWPYRVLATPATLTAQTSAKFRDDPVVIAWKSVLDQMALAAQENPVTPVAAYWGPSEVSSEIESSGILEGVVQKALAGDASLDDALADAKRGLEDILAG